MAFIQTADMLELFKRNYEPGILIAIIPQTVYSNRYQMDMLLITGIDQDIGSILTYGIGLFNWKAKYSLRWIMSKFYQQAQVVNKLIKNIIYEYDPKLITALDKVVDQSKTKLIISHYSVIEVFSKIIQSSDIQD